MIAHVILRHGAEKSGYCCKLCEAKALKEAQKQNAAPVYKRKPNGR